MASPPPAEISIAILPWGDLIEDFLDTIGVSLEQFAEEMTGGWLFGYVDALRTAGIRTVIICMTGRVQSPTRITHRPTGAPLWLLPPSSAYLYLRRRKLSAPAGAPAPGRGFSTRLRRRAKTAIRDVGPYLSTPVVSVARVLRHEGCCAIICQEYESPRFDSCVAIGRVLRLPVFATFQGGTWQASGSERFVRPLTMRAASGFFVAPEAEINRLISHYDVPERKIEQVFNPLDLEQWGLLDRQRARLACGLPQDVRVIVWHGRVDIQHKGLDVLLDAWKQVFGRCEGGVRLLMVGTGPDAAALRERIQSLRLEGIHWIDRYVLDREELRRYLSAGDVYVLASRREGFAVAPLEAMACELPLVTTDVPGMADLVGRGGEHGGLIVPQEAPDALADALVALLSDAELSRGMGERARARIASRFSLKAVGARLSDAIRSALPAAKEGAARRHPPRA